MNMQVDVNLGNIRTKKAMIRKEILEKRHAMSKQECADLSKKICEAFLASEEYKNAGSILLYKSYNNEVDTDMIFEAAKADGKITAYPLSQMVEGEPDLSFYVIDDPATLKPGYMGILEPDMDLALEVFLGCADICITPGVAFDSKCHRMGYGKAFYDRFIRLNCPRKTVGLAYSMQIAPDFDTEASDKPVDIVITDTKVYRR